jgi:hypothetical protein
MRPILRWWHSLEEPPQWTSAMCALYAMWAGLGMLLLRGVTMLPGAEAGVTWLLSVLLMAGGLMASPATVCGARWAERIGNLLVGLAFLLGLVVFVATRANWPHSWFWAVVALFISVMSLLALRMTHIVTTAYRPGSRAARSARGAAESRRLYGSGNAVGDAGPGPGR